MSRSLQVFELSVRMRAFLLSTAFPNISPSFCQVANPGAPKGVPDEVMNSLYAGQIQISSSSTDSSKSYVLIS